MALILGDQSVIPPRHQIDFQELKNAKNEVLHVKEAFELLKETAAWIALGISIREAPQPEALERNQAICAGQLVRMCKIIRVCLRQIVDDHGGGHQMALAREFIESAAAVTYLLEDVNDEARFDAYMHDSLIPERELLQTIRLQVKERGGRRLLIEDRMERSVHATLKGAGVKLEDIPARKSNGWPSIETRIKLLGPTAYEAYRSGSAAVHGTWSDLARNHLEQVESRFILQFEATDFRPQPLLLIGTLSTAVLRKYLAIYVPLAAVSLTPALKDLDERIRAVDAAHEELINSL
ncbi:DUF5677 domain-containing protein [Arthrobacter psychrochitiniphilus]|uniref:DUF5677 domain-containing protein n=1 Tax=Arthrobacter psychrochitiniphilus TaxID=291045 RepID=UPI003F7C337D